MNERYCVMVSQDAKQMLDSHTAFLAQSSEPAAQRLADSAIEAINSLKLMPSRCPKFLGVSPPLNLYRYLLFGKRYALVFEVKENMVYVDYVVDCRQDYAWLLT